MRITGCEIVVIGDGRDVDPDRGAVEPLPLLSVHTDVGISGLSEMFRVPAGVARSALVGPDSFFGSQLLNTEFVHPEAIWNRLYDNMTHSNRRGWAIRCLGALDVALWDIYGKSQGLPVFELMGGAERNPFQTDPSQTNRATEIVPYATIVSDNWEPDVVLRQQVERCETLAAEGFRAFKVEPMHSTRETAVELIKRTREALGPEPILALDVGYGYNDHATALWVSKRIEQYDVYFFETPFPVDVPDAYARLAAQTTIPLAMGEHSATRFEFLDMMDRGGVTVCQPYASNVGGITEAKRIVDLAKPRGALVIPGNWSTQILGTANAHVVAYSPISPYVEYAAAQIYESPLRAELQAIGLPVFDGAMPLPTQPGIGIDVPAELISRFKLDL
jgi:L-alanine-DL-glutamate epimerase-like enolase superfamily enzyme